MRVHSLFPVRVIRAVGVDASGQMLTDITHWLRALSLVLYARVRKDPVLLQDLARFLAPKAAAVILRLKIRGELRSFVVMPSPPPLPLPVVRTPISAEVRLSEAGARMDVTQLMRQLRAFSSPNPPSNQALYMYLSFMTGINVRDLLLTEVIIEPTRIGPVLRRVHTQL